MIKAKKSLGQNFLIDKNILEKIVKINNVENKAVLEIGPGTGNLTSYILKNKPRKLYVIEKDNNLASKLKEKFKDKIIIINEDVLKIDEKNIADEKLTVFGNLPYNISTEILCKWILNLTNKNFWFNYLILMFQKEVADRIISDFGSSNYGRLSVLSHWKLEVKKICNIYPTSFFPKPRVDSSLLFFKPKKKFYEIKNPKNLEKITRIFFSQRRKMLKKPFNQIFGDNLQIVDKLEIDLKLRPQNLDQDTYYKLTKEYEELRS